MLTFDRDGLFIPYRKMPFALVRLVPTEDGTKAMKIVLTDYGSVFNIENVQIIH